ncbi:MAG: fluoride efflux transporter CrcB [Flavobacteriales bacterium]|nr:fluoride efflux transporter CrcB [Flavobacteriales bacterium]
MNYLAVFIGGGLGSLARFGVSKFITANFTTNLPVATLLSNILSCIVLASLVGVFSDKIIEHPWLRFFLLIGFCGGFSTFSTFSYESLELIRSGNLLYGIANIAVSIFACLGIIYFFTKNSQVAI